MANITEKYLEAAKLSSKVISVAHTAGDDVTGDTYTLVFGNGFSSTIEFAVGYSVLRSILRNAIATSTAYDYVAHNDISSLKSHDIAIDLRNYIRRQLEKFPATADVEK